MTAFNLRVGSATHVGQLRKINQDAIVVEGGIFGVADGMGGHQGGEVASAVAVEVLGQGLQHTTPAGFEAAVKAANRAVYEQGQAREDLAGMGTTLVAIAEVIVDDEPHLVIVNVGDSRGYLLRDRDLVQITEDHSLVADLVRAGRITPEEAEHHPRRNIVTRVLGLDDTVRVDQFAVLPFEGDRFLLCSDGLTNEVNATDITATLRRIDDPNDAAEELVRMANAAGGRDNISVVIVDVLDQDGRSVVPAGAAVDEPDEPDPIDDEADDAAADTDVEPEDADDTVEAADEPADDGPNELDALGALGATAAVGSAGLLGDAGATDVDSIDPADAGAAASVFPPEEADEPVDETSAPPGTDDPSLIEAEAAPDVEDELDDDEGGLDDSDDDEGTAEPADDTAADDAPADGDPADVDPAVVDDVDDGTRGEVGLGDFPPDEVPAAASDAEPDDPADSGSDPEQAGDADHDDAEPQVAELDDSGTVAPEDGDGEADGDEEAVPRGRRARRRAEAAAVAAGDVAAEADDAPSTPGEKARIRAGRVGGEADAPGVGAPGGPAGGRRTTPDLAGFGRALDDEQLADADADIVVEEDLDALIPKRRRFSWRVAAFLFIFCAVIGIAIGALGVYARGTYYVGFDNNRVAIFQGRPGGVLFFDPTVEAHSNVVRTDLLPVSEGQVDDQPDFGTFSEADLFIGNLQLVIADKTPVVSQPGTFDSNPTSTTSTTVAEDPLPPDAPTPAGSPTTSTP